MGVLYGIDHANKVVRDVIAGAGGEKSNYPYYERIGNKILNDNAVDITSNISDSTKEEIRNRWDSLRLLD